MKKIFVFAPQFIALFLFCLTVNVPGVEDARASDKAACAPTDTMCLIGVLEDSVPAIPEEQWRDQIYREIAKLLTHEKQTDRAISMVGKIVSPDTKAMTIRGIGMAAAAEKGKFSAGEYLALFAKLTAEAHKITHPPSYAIALTYISMSQAMAGDANGATATALTMNNAALRNKAFAENAEIHAESGAVGDALDSITHIDDEAFRDKAHYLIARIFSDDGHPEKALQAIDQITNPYQKAQSLLYTIAKQVTPAETSLITPKPQYRDMQKDMPQ